MSAAEILYKGRYSKQIAHIITRTDFAKIKRLMEVNGEVWALDIDEVGVPSIKEITVKALELLSKAETDPNDNCSYQYKGLAALKGSNQIALIYMPILISVEI